MQRSDSQPQLSAPPPVIAFGPPPPPPSRLLPWLWWLATRGLVLLVLVFAVCYLVFLFAPAPWAEWLRWWPTKALGVVRFDPPTEELCAKMVDGLCAWSMISKENLPVACRHSRFLCGKGWVKVAHWGVYYGGEGLYKVLYPLVGWVVEMAHEFAVPG